MLQCFNFPPNFIRYTYADTQSSSIALYSKHFLRWLTLSSVIFGYDPTIILANTFFIHTITKNRNHPKTSAFHTTRIFSSVPFVTASSVHLFFLILTQVYELSLVKIHSRFVQSRASSATRRSTTMGKKHGVN